MVFGLMRLVPKKNQTLEKSQGRRHTTRQLEVQKPKVPKEKPEANQIHKIKHPIQLLKKAL
ncbi:MAG: hypothetical protein SWO11_15170 [Thermodesulfobacteriota bacterium]|nr:hypothetical protein [Thermodesulfobacteriota bacterium]